MMIPKNREKDPAFIIEFKVCSRVKKETLEDAVQEALKQIVDKKYDAELVALGVPQERIRHYGFAFAGKNVLIGAEWEKRVMKVIRFFWRKMVFLLTHYDIDSMINLIFKIYFYVRIFYLWNDFLPLP